MKKRRIKKSAILIIVLVISGLSCIATSFIYLYLASPIDKNNRKEIDVTIKEGTSSREIANILENKGLIRSSTFFLIYSKLNKCDSLKASSYTFKKSMSLNTIFETICEGDYKKDVITITFKEGKRITDYAKVISNNTNYDEEEVIEVVNDKEYLNKLINKYWFLTEDILNPAIYYPLEGYLYPDTYKFENKNVKIEKIIETMLDETENKIVDLKDEMTSGLHTPHEYFTLASMTELEGTNKENRKMIAGIFENRLKANMSLGSDVTAYYALQKPMTSDLTVEEFNTLNPYNTRSAYIKGLPVGPICSVTKDTLSAAITPTENDYLYFVADKNGNIYYSRTSAEQTKKVAEIKEQGNWIW